MPAIDVTMARSLNGGVWGTVTSRLVNSLTAEVMRRDAAQPPAAGSPSQADEIRRTFTNWNVCMTKDYCKWPAFAVIVILSLIIIGVTICAIRCCCLGMSCCCGCCRCLKCCGNCCGCCDPPGDRPHKYSNESFNTQQGKNGGYRSQAPMEAHFPPPPSTSHSTQAFPTGPPQYAEFDMKKSSPDALPAMPSWEESGKKKVLVEEMEMDDLPKQEHQVMQRMPPRRGPLPGNNPNTMAELPGQAYNLQTNMATNYMNAHGRQPVNGYGGGGGGGGGGGQPYNSDSGHTSGTFEMDQAYDAHAPAAVMGMASGRQVSAPIQHAYGPRQLVQRQAPLHTSMQATLHELDGQERFQMDGTPAPYGSDVQMRASPAPQSDYGNVPPTRFRSPPLARDSEHGMAQERYNSPIPSHEAARSPVPQGGEIGHGQSMFDPPASPFGNAPSRISSPKPVAYRTYSPAPLNNSHITNNAGFDFNSGYSRPQNQDEPETPEAYPGYKPYTPSTPTTPTNKAWH